MKVIVERKRWVRGNLVDARTRNESRLLNGRGNMCCVGFYARAMGLLRADILNVGTLAGVQKSLHHTHCGFTHTKDDEKFHNLYALNDDPCLGDATREALLIAEGAKHDIQFEFVD